jgi:LysR family nitrogen assimilation transcriptional regulator
MGALLVHYKYLLSIAGNNKKAWMRWSAPRSIYDGLLHLGTRSSIMPALHIDTACIVDLRGIRYFIEIADLGSITRAADRLGIAQPALSRHLRGMEEELGIQLLVRLPRGVQLTDGGRQFLDHSRQLVREFSRLKNEVRARKELPRGRLVLGMTPTVGTLLLPATVESMRRQHPDVVLKIVEGSSVTLYDALLTGHVDIAVLTNPPASRALAVTPLVSEPIVVLAVLQPRGTHRFFTLAELAKTPTMVTPAIRTIVERQLNRLGVRLNVDVEMDSVAAIRQLVLRGVGVTVMPVSTFHEDIRDGRMAVYPIADANIHRVLSVGVPADRRRSAAFDVVTSIVTEETNRLLDLGTFDVSAASTRREGRSRPTRRPVTRRRQPA